MCSLLALTFKEHVGNSRAILKRRAETRPRSQSFMLLAALALAGLASSASSL
jgi:hypothetical protein